MTSSRRADGELLGELAVGEGGPGSEPGSPSVLAASIRGTLTGTLTASHTLCLLKGKHHSPRQLVFTSII